jgi:hypothetical protein
MEVFYYEICEICRYESSTRCLPRIEIIDGFDIEVNGVIFKLLRANMRSETIFAHMNENFISDNPLDNTMLEIKQKSRFVIDSEGVIQKQHYHDGGLAISMHNKIKDLIMMEEL